MGLVNGLAMTPGMVWPSQACAAGEKLQELLGGCHHDAGSDRWWHRDREKWDSGHILKIKPTGLADGLGMGYEKGEWSACLQVS